MESIQSRAWSSVIRLVKGAATAYLVVYITSGFFSPEPAFAQWEGAEVVVLAGSEDTERSTRYSLALDPDDWPHVVWREFPAARGAIIYSREEISGWSDPIEVGTDGGDHHDPAIEWDLIGNSPVVVFEGSLTGEGDSEIYLATWNGTGFDATRITENDIPDYNPALAVDGFQHYHVVCITEVDGVYRLRYLTDATGEPSDQLVDSGNLGPYGSGASPCISATEDGIAHIAYRGGWYGGYRIHHAFNGEAGGSDWDWEEMPSGNVEDFSSDIDVDAMGGIHLAVSGNDCWGCPFKTYYFHKPVYEDWEPYVFIPFGMGLSSPSLAVDRTNTPHLAMVEVGGNIVTGRLYYASEANGWTPVLIIGTDHATPSLAVDFGGYGHLVCTTGPNTGIEDVLYLKSPATVAGVGEPGLDPFAFTLHAAPNPFMHGVAFTLGSVGENPGRSITTLDIHDISGRLVRRLVAGPTASGLPRAFWDGHDSAGQLASPGVYLVNVGAGRTIKVARLR